MKRIRTLTLAAVAISMMSAIPVSAGSSPSDSPRSAGTSTAEAVAGSGRGALGDLEQAFPSDVVKARRNIQLATGPGEATYLVRLADPAVPSYTGGRAGIPSTTPDSGQKLDTSAPSVRSYEQFLVEEQADFVTRVGSTIGRSPDVLFTYQFAVNGLAMSLTADEVMAIANDRSVVSITPDVQRVLHSDAGPEWIDAHELWNGMVDLNLPANYQGEGIIIGTIDTGISPLNDSFADIDDDGYDHENPWGTGVYVGVCDSTDPSYDPTFPCNDKLIGAWEFGGLGGGSAVDYDGHGSHTAGTSGGSVVNGVSVTTAAGFITPPLDISGVAPRANVISYLGCCSLSGLTASIEQTILDGVDVINYSIGSSGASAAWDDFDTIGFLNARNAGIFVATSNGNAGPNDATTGSPADAPWIISVGASTHNRHNGNVLTGLTSSIANLPNIEGASVTGALVTPAPIVNAAAVGDALCQNSSGNEAAFTGAIVVCSRGVNGRVAKSQNVLAQGAVGYVLINDQLNGASLLGDEYALPGLFISYDDGQVLLDWLGNGGTGHAGTIAGTQFTIDDARADYLTSFSSRGPNRAMDVIVPSVSAPGANILAAVTSGDPDGGNIHGFISGTSMASPHVAGAGALLAQARPDWSPAEMQSALMTSAVTSVLNHDGTPATPYQQGSGRIDVSLAVMAGLLFDETNANYLAANPAEGGDPKTLNVPSFANSQCLVECQWTRVANVPASAPAGVTWTPSVVSDAGLTIDVGLSVATVSAADTMTITVDADVLGAPDGEVLFARITLTPDNPDVPNVTMPVAVVPSSGVLPDSVDIETRRNAGSHEVTDLQSVALTEFTGSIHGWVEGTQTADELAHDSTNGDPYDDLTEVGVYLVDVAADAELLVAEIIQSDAPDLDLFVGTGDTPSAATEVCSSASATALEYCEVVDPAAGTWWIVVQNWADPAVPSDPAQAFVLSHAVVPSTSAGNGDVIGPVGAVPTGEPYDVTVTWDLPDAEEGDVWYGVTELGSEPSTPGNVGGFLVRLERLADDVTKTAGAPDASAGETVDYDITVQPNVTPTDLEYTIVDTVPDGMTIDESSVTAGGVVDGQTITWTVNMPTAVGVSGDYFASTPATSTQCLAWSGFLDLADFGVDFNVLDGDTVAGSFFANIAPFEFYGAQYPSLTVSEDGLVTVPGGYGGSPWVPQTLPNPAQPNGVIAPLWSDLELSVVDGRGIRTATDSGAGVAIAQWDDPFEWTGDDSVGPSVGSFQAWIYNAVSDSRPEMTFEYESLGALPAAVTIGIENFTGTSATALVNAADPTGEISAGGTICLDYIGPTFDPAVLEYSVTVDAPAAPGIVTNIAEHTTDDLYAQVAIASADLELLGGSVEVDPASVDFGDVVLGESAVETVMVTNDGTADLTVANATAGAPFTVDASDCTAAPLAPAESCNIEVEFEPTVGGPATGELTITSDASTSPDTIALTGTGVSPALNLDMANVDFGDVVVGDTATETVTVTNDGTSVLTIANVATSAPYSVDATDCDTAIVPDGTCELSITFAPTADGVAAGNVTITSDADSSPDTIAVTGTGVTPEAITPIVPGRYWDTRDELTFDTLFRNTGRVTGGTSFEVQISGRGDIPDGAKAVIANLTAISPSSLGFATMYPCTDAVPTASHVNYFASDVVANSSIVPLNEDGALCVFTLATSDFALDISGFLAADSPLVGIDPARFLETRSVPGFTTFDGVSQGTGRVLAGLTITVPIAGRGSVPDSAAAALVTVTAVDPAADGFLTVFPCGTRPDTSTVNYFAGQFVPNGAVAELSDDGDVCIYSLATTDILIDVSGYVPAGAAGIATMTPKRLLDTRPGESTVDGEEAGGGRVSANGFIEVQVTGRAGIPADATAAILNVGVVYPDSIGFVTLYPCGDIPVASNVNHTTGGVVRANNSITKLSAEGTVCIYTLSGTDLILDVAGWIE